MTTRTTTIYETVHGSQCYGLATPESDVDVKGLLIGPAHWYMGFGTSPEQVEHTADYVLYELRKFFRLATAANPTVLELLWTDAEHHRVVTPIGERVLEARERFLSKRVAQTFGGYGLSQLRRIRTHRKWLLDPPKEPPARKTFGLPERTVIPRDQLGAAEALLADGRIDAAELSPNFLAVMDRERSYRAARKQWQQYQQWLKHRNPKRAALEAEFGYDTKHAMHLVRLLRMGREILATGDVRVRRDDREELLGVRRGAWTYDVLIERAEAMHADLAKAKAASALPEAPDEEALNLLCAGLVAAQLEEKRA